MATSARTWCGGFDWDVLDEAMGVANPGSWWELGSAQAIEVARVRLFGFDGNLAHAQASFVVPALPPGRYALSFCDVGCVRSLGDIIPSRVVLAPDRLTAQLSERVERLTHELRETRWRLRAARGRIRSLEGTADGVAALEARVTALTVRLAELERRDDRPARVREGAPTAGWIDRLGWAAAAFILGSWASSPWWRRRRMPLPRVPDDLRSLEPWREGALTRASLSRAPASRQDTVEGSVFAPETTSATRSRGSGT